MAFSWEKLAQQMKATYGARLSAPSRTGLRLVLQAQFTEQSLPRLLEDAERGALDSMVAATGARFVQEICQGERCLYNHVPPVTLAFLPPYEDVSTSELKQLLNQHKIEVLLLTTTETERKALHVEMAPLPGHTGLVEGAIHHVTYRLGQLGRYPVAHAESTMGSQARDGAAFTVQDAIRELSPKAVIVVGIAFGLNSVKQRLGDVVIAETVLPYELQRVDMTATYRGQPTPCGPLLSERFRTRRADWKLKRGEDAVRVFQGAMLSGEKLVDNLAFREGLLKAFPHALAGEMEGAGVYAATDRQRVEVILIKGLCDWGDGSKTNRAQAFAARAAVSLTEHVLSKKEVLAPLVTHEVGPTPSEVGTLLTPASQFLASQKEEPPPPTHSVPSIQEPPTPAPAEPPVALQPPAAKAQGKELPRRQGTRSGRLLISLPLFFIGYLLLTENPEALFVLNDLLCRLEVSGQCTEVGSAYANGAGVQKDLVKAAEYYQRACTQQDAMGCTLLGWAYTEGLGVARDPAKAFKAYRAACERQDMQGCNLLGWSYANGAGVSQNPGLAARHYQIACKGKLALGCFYLGRAYQQGLGVIRDPAKAAEAYRLACDGGHRESCSAPSPQELLRELRK